MDDDGWKKMMQRDTSASTSMQPLQAAADNAPMIGENAASTAAAAAVNVDGAEDDDEMPLLFMDGLPSDFQRSAQLAAIATFMEGSDDDDNEEGGAEDEGCTRGAPRRQTRKAAARQTRKQAPYAKNKGAKTSSKQAAKELQLYLSMFKM